MSNTTQELLADMQRQHDELIEKIKNKFPTTYPQTIHIQQDYKFTLTDYGDSGMKRARIETLGYGTQLSVEAVEEQGEDAISELGAHIRALIEILNEMLEIVEEAKLQ